MARSLDPKKIKSAQRALEVLEYFQGGRSEATVMDIARSMGYPQSSTSELLGCLVSLGYLTRDRSARTYRPTARVAVLGAWVQPNLFREGRLLPLMDELAQEANAAIVLGNRVGLEIQYIHSVAAAGAADVVEGASASLAHSAMGKAVLAAMDRNYMRKLMHRLNAESAPEMRAPFDQLALECDAIQAQGYACAPDGNGGWMIATLLAQPGHDESLTLGILLSREQFETSREHYVQLLRGAVARLAVRVQTAPRPMARREDASAPMQMAI